MRTLRVATTNRGKHVEIARMVLAGLGPLAVGLEVVDLRGRRDHVPPREDGGTYEANARIKAAAVADGRAAVLADDSGIEVAALGGQPGLHSARWARDPEGGQLDGAGLNRALLARLAGVADRRAAMVCTVVLMLPGGQLACGRGRVVGTVADDQRGAGGFGYDAVFVLSDGRRLAEVAGEEKDRVGHRGEAVRAVLPALSRWLAR